VFTGAFADEITSVAAEVAVLFPSVFVAVTATFSVWSTSPEATWYVFDVAPEIGLQLAPDASHCCHWYEKPVGEFAQLPLFAVKVLPSLGCPEIVGAELDCGAAAVAACVRTAAASSESSAVARLSRLLVENLMVIPLRRRCIAGGGSHAAKV
jgi:hypothetical protein